MHELDTTVCTWVGLHLSVSRSVDKTSNRVYPRCEFKRQDGSQLLTESGALQLGLGIALEYILDIGVDNIWRQIQFLAGILRDKLRELPGVTVQDKGCLLCGIVSFTLVGVPPSRPLRIVLPSPSHTPHVSLTLGAADFRSSATLPTELHVTKAECTLQWQSFGCSDHMLGTCG